MVMFKPGQGLNSALCLLVLLLAGSNELNPAAEAFSCSGNGTRQQVSLLFTVYCLLFNEQSGTSPFRVVLKYAIFEFCI